jgi:hypothetical protein
MTPSDMRNWLFKNYKKSLSINSRFYEHDMNEYAVFLSKKNNTEIENIFNRQWTIAHISQSEINANCQLNGLPKL